MKDRDHFAISGAWVVFSTWPGSGPGGPEEFYTSSGSTPPSPSQANLLAEENGVVTRALAPQHGRSIL